MHVLITGASSGIGASIARELGRHPQNRLTLVARRRERLEALADELAAETRIEVRDLSLAPLELSWLEEDRSHFGPVDVLVNNAGVQVVGRTHEVDPDAGEASLRVNVFSPLRLIRALLPEMVERDSGTIVNIASLAALAPTPYMAYYNASKGGLAAASEALRGELRESGVKVVTVYPGIISETEMATSTEAKYETSRLLGMQPRGTSAELARRIASAIERGDARLIYPPINTAARWFPGVTRWLVDRFTPPLR
ncbi:MAG: SDR family NAD(P)-dependent oxidoreductase [Deltaproteobacteria bacterium]|jgi:short-subunit dehydrogenase|nr:SDR family NAD(P)-dependent oxidoreductase [Deltaproteobacteria bacterium]